MYHVLGFVEFYISPFIFAIGFIFLFSGIVNYFIIGPGFEEDRKEKGRNALLWATLLFSVGLAVFGLSSWLFGFVSQIEEEGGFNTGRPTGVLPVPNVPGVQ